MPAREKQHWSSYVSDRFSSCSSNHSFNVVIWNGMFYTCFLKNKTNTQVLIINNIFLLNYVSCLCKCCSFSRYIVIKRWRTCTLALKLLIVYYFCDKLSITLISFISEPSKGKNIDQGILRIINQCTSFSFRKEAWKSVPQWQSLLLLHWQLLNY